MCALSQSGLAIQIAEEEFPKSDVNIIRVRPGCSPVPVEQVEHQLAARIGQHGCHLGYDYVFRHGALRQLPEVV